MIWRKGMKDQQRFLNEDLVLRVSQSIDPFIFDITKYEPFLDALCGTREYQKQAIRNTLYYLLSGRYSNLYALAEENYLSNDKIQDRYGSLKKMLNHLQFPNQLSCSIDLATGTGKSFVMYGIARIMLAEGIVDRVLVLCPSVTIEDELTKKFINLSSDAAFKDLIPSSAVIRNPHIINGTESIVSGTICIENYHATLEHVKSSIRDSLAARGNTTLVLNDEIHHVYNKPIDNSTARELKKWKEFLSDEKFGFKYLVGFSGTCYIDDEYFADVIYRYSLRQAIEDGFVKAVDYVSEDTSQSQDEKFQKIWNNHNENKNKYRRVKPLTILITKDIQSCKILTDNLVHFLVEYEKIDREDALKKVLIVTSDKEHQSNVLQLPNVDNADNPVEWITSVSMLTEGWDVKNVFQIVPHEEKAFNSKLLIAQVLGRGLRIPEQYKGERLSVTVFNHDSWSSKIKDLVNEVMEIEKRVYSYVIPKDVEYNFSLHQINYNKLQTVEEFEQTEEYNFNKGYIKLISQSSELVRETTYESITHGQYTRKTLVHYKMYNIDEVAETIHYRLSSIDMENDGETNYSKRYNLEWIKELIRESLKRIGEKDDIVSEENKQRLYAAFGTIHRGAAKRVRYQMKPEAVYIISTDSRAKDSAGIASLRRRDISVFADEYSLKCSDEETRKVLDDIKNDESLPRSAWIYIDNSYLFKTPLNIVIANHKPEREFVKHLIKLENSQKIDSWIKSTDRDFYSIEYAWRKNEHSKRGFFNPDFFIKKDKKVIVIEIKGDEEITNVSLENRGKYRYANKHFRTLNSLQNEIEYHFHFLSPKDYGTFFKYLRDDLEGVYSSSLDAVLDDYGNGTY